MFCFIFIVFFAQNIVMLAIGYHLCGWAWYVFATGGVTMGIDELGELSKLVSSRMRVKSLPSRFEDT